MNCIVKYVLNMFWNIWWILWFISKSDMTKWCLGRGAASPAFQDFKVKFEKYETHLQNKYQKIWRSGSMCNTQPTLTPGKEWIFTHLQKQLRLTHYLGAKTLPTGWHTIQYPAQGLKHYQLSTPKAKDTIRWLTHYSGANTRYPQARY